MDLCCFWPFSAASQHGLCFLLHEDYEDVEVVLMYTYKHCNEDTVFGI